MSLPLVSYAVLKILLLSSYRYLIRVNFPFRIRNAQQINPFHQSTQINLIRPPHYFHHLPKCIINPHLINLNTLNPNNPIGRIGINNSLKTILFNPRGILLQAFRPRNR